MRRWCTYWLLVILINSTIVGAAFAQDNDVIVGGGGTIIESNIGDDPASFNPILAKSVTESRITDKMYPSLIGLDRNTLLSSPNVPHALATGWEYDETGTILTITLREDAYWSDGSQITADDWLWAYHAVKSGQTSSPRTYVVYELDDGSITDGPVHDVIKVDDFTLQFTIGNVQTDDDGAPLLDEYGQYVLIPNCDAINIISDIATVPEHAFRAAFDDNYVSMEADPYFVPKTKTGIATFGPFTDPSLESGIQVRLVGDPNYPDTAHGTHGTFAGEWVLRNVEDQHAEYEMFLEGEFTYIAVNAANQNELRSDGRFQVIEYPENGYTFMALNMADPTNPLPSRDENGELLNQGHHPFLGDLNVRQALAHAIDVRSIIGSRPENGQPASGVLDGNGYLLATHNHPGLSRTDDELAELGVAPYSYDLALAGQLLDEAGWIDTDGDGIRECSGCRYAEEGTKAGFELLTNAGNTLRESIGMMIRDDLAEIGVEVEFQTVEFSVLVDELLGQQFDAAIIGWGLGIPFNPGNKIAFGIGSDRPGAGYNFVSYINPDYDALVDYADSLTAAEDGSYRACDPAQREIIYAQTQKMLWEDLPYIWLYAQNAMFAAQPNLINFDPLPYNVSWNIDSWIVGE